MTEPPENHIGMLRWLLGDEGAAEVLGVNKVDLRSIHYRSEQASKTKRFDLDGDLLPVDDHQWSRKKKRRANKKSQRKRRAEKKRLAQLLTLMDEVKTAC